MLHFWVFTYSLQRAPIPNICLDWCQGQACPKDPQDAVLFVCERMFSGIHLDERPEFTSSGANGEVLEQADQDEVSSTG